MKNDKIDLKWSVGYVDEPISKPTLWFDAKVPGAVQLDVLHTLPHQNWHFSDNYKQFDGLEDKYWVYTSSFTIEKLLGSEVLRLKVKGIDYKYDIYINDYLIHSHEGMFSRCELDLSSHVVESNNEIKIVIHPAPKEQGLEGRDQASQSTKPAVSYGWDWHPRVIPLGIWDEISLVKKRQGALLSFDYYYLLSSNLKKAKFLIEGKSTCKIGKIIFHIYSNVGDLVFEKEYYNFDQCFLIEDFFAPEHLWWPYEFGDPYLYDCQLLIFDSKSTKVDVQNWKWGFRRSKLIMNEGTWDEPATFPKSRSLPPITLEINGKRLFAKGTNWVNPEVFPGVIDNNRYKELLELAKGAHFNLLRVWGGGIINKDYFYQWCDINGMMIWNEFPLSCCDYKGSPKYLKVLEKEAVSIIKRLRRYASSIMWCGGNELFNNWSGMNDQYKALRLLNSLCLQHDKDTPFLPTSPIEGMGHGHYLFWDENERKDVFKLMNASKNTAYTEFGMPSPSDIEILQGIIPKEEFMIPVKNTKSWREHHAFDAWVKDTWLSENIIRKYFPNIETMTDLVNAGQKLQSIGYRAIYEAARQQWPYCSMALNWCFNEPWPTAANNSIVQYSGKVKPAYEAIKMACRPIMSSAKVPKFKWKEGEDFTFQLFFLNHSNNALPSSSVEVYINDELILSAKIPELPSYSNYKGPKINYQINNVNSVILNLVTDNTGWDSTYEFFIKKKNKPKKKVLNV